MKLNKFFTVEEIQTECPQIINCTEAKYGYGLLQAMKHDGVCGKVASFNFLHLSVQEYLAADYVAQLPLCSQLKIIQEKFWIENFSNMFKFYVNFTFANGQPQALRCFLSGKNIPPVMFLSYYHTLTMHIILSTYNPVFASRYLDCVFKFILNCFTNLLFKYNLDKEIIIAEDFLENKLKCMYLYQCFKEAGDDRMCQAIENVFCKREINFSKIKLSLTDIDYIATFLVHSSIRQWEIVKFSYCHIQDDGLDILHSALQGGTVRIGELVLAYDGLTDLSSKRISDIILTCGVVDVSVGGDDKGVGETKGFYSTIIADPKSKLEKLSLGRNKVTSKSAITIFQLMKEGKSKINMLYINNNEITDEAVETIAAALQEDKTLRVLKLEQNRIPGEDAERIVKALEHNNTLQKLDLSAYPKDIQQKIMSQKETINKKRKCRGCQVELEINFLNF